MPRPRSTPFILAALLAAAVARPATADEAADRAAVAAASSAFSAAYVRGDTTAIGELYTEDAVLLPPGRTVRGRAAIRRYFAPGPGRENVSHAMESESLSIDGDTAVDVGTWRNAWRKLPEDAGAPPREAAERYVVVWRRGADGAWRMAVDMWHRPQP